MKAKIRRHKADKAGEPADEDDKEDIDVHMWEKRGKLVMDVP